MTARLVTVRLVLRENPSVVLSPWLDASEPEPLGAPFCG
jgi:hypothetical protein